MHQLKNGQSILDRYRSHRTGNSRNETIGFRVPPEAKERLREIADREDVGLSSVLRGLTHDFIIASQFGRCDAGLKEAIAVELLNDIETWYADEEQISDTAAQLRSMIESTSDR